MYLNNIYNIFVSCWFWQTKSGLLFYETILDSISYSELLVTDNIYIYPNVNKMAIYCCSDVDQSILWYNWSSSSSFPLGLASQKKHEIWLARVDT